MLFLTSVRGGLCARKTYMATAKSDRIVCSSPPGPRAAARNCSGFS